MIWIVSEHEGEAQEVEFRVDVPEKETGGRYANFLSVWHTGHEFTLDFSATQPPQPQNSDDPESPVVVPCHVVARVRIPPSLVFDVLRALNDNMTRYEAMFGEIQRPEQREEWATMTALASITDCELLGSAPAWYAPESPKPASYTVERAPSFQVAVHRTGETWTVADQETGIYGAGASPSEALDDFLRAVKEHLDVLERQELLSDDLTAQLRYLRERVQL
jgi:hypothetical protein